MLRLNSQYAKSYLREEPAKPSYQCSQKNERKENRNWGHREQEWQMQQGKGCEKQYEVAGTRKDSATQRMANVYEDRQDIAFYDCEQNKSRFRQPLEANPHSYNKSPLRTRAPNLPSNDLYRHLGSKVQTEPFPIRTKFERYDQPQPPYRAEGFGDKKDFVAKHNKRNEEIKNRICRQNSHGSRNCNQPSQRSYNQQYEARTKLNMQKDEFYEERAQRFNRKLVFDDQYEDKAPTQRLNSRDVSAIYRQKFQREEQEYELTSSGSGTERFPARPVDYNSRRNSSFKDSQQTPSRYLKTTALQPGSAEKKRSLIEKSQMLQQKLKKLTSTQAQAQTNAGQPERTSQFQYQQTANTKTVPNCRTSNYVSARGTNLRKYNSQKQPQESMKQTQAGNISQAYRPSARKVDLLRTPSPMPEARTSGNQGQAIQRIMELNEKINQRIHSIISNYAKK